MRPVLLFLLSSLMLAPTHAFSRQPIATRSAFARTTSRTTTTTKTTTVLYSSTTVEPPVKEQTKRKTNKRTNDRDDDNAINNGDDIDSPLEYLQDNEESREMDDPFHILLLGSTFEKKKITVEYVAGSLEYVLNMPAQEAVELSAFACEEGMACLGTWPREECLSLGKQLQVRDLVCRVVPYAAGGQRGWQAKDANEYSNSGDSAGDYN